MKSIRLFAVALLVASCQTHQPEIMRTSHWNIQSLENRTSHHLLNYQPTRDGDYGDFRREENRALAMTLRRHLLNQNPENPFQDWGDSYATNAYPQDLFVNPFDILYLGAVAGGLAAGAAGFFVIEIDASIGGAQTILRETDDLLGTTTQEHVECLVTGSFRTVAPREYGPVTPEAFRVRNTTVVGR